MKKVLSIIINVLLWVFIVFAAFVTVLSLSAQKSDDKIPSIFGKSLVSVVSDSMNPTFKKGDLIFDEDIAAEEKSKLAVGDVISFITDLDGDGTDEINTHRIVSLRTEGGYVFYTTRGDNKETNTKDDDKEVRADMIVGKYTGKKLSGVGSVISFLQTSTGFLICIVVPLVLFFLFEAYNFISLIVSMKNKGKISKEDEDEIKKKAVEEYLKQQKQESSSKSSAE